MKYPTEVITVLNQGKRPGTKFLGEVQGSGVYILSCQELTDLSQEDAARRSAMEQVEAAVLALGGKKIRITEDDDNGGWGGGTITIKGRVYK